MFIKPLLHTFTFFSFFLKDGAIVYHGGRVFVNTESKYIELLMILYIKIFSFQTILSTFISNPRTKRIIYLGFTQKNSRANMFFYSAFI